MKIQRREIVTLMFGLLVILGLLYYTYFYQPFIKEQKEFAADIAEKTTELTLAQNQQSQLSSIQGEIDELSLLLSDSVSDIMVSEDNVLLLVYLEEVLEGASVNKNISFDSTAVSLDYCSLQRVSLSFQTDYDSLKIILNELENAKYRNSISSLALSYTEISGEYITEVVEEETPELPGFEDVVDDETQVEIIEKFRVLPFNLSVSLSLEFYYYNDPIDRYKEYDFAQGDYFNNYIIPRPEEIFVPVQSIIDFED